MEIQFDLFENLIKVSRKILPKYNQKHNFFI